MAHPLLSSRRPPVVWARFVHGILDSTRQMAEPRPHGGADEGDVLRPTARLYIAVLAVAALLSLAVALAGATFPERDHAVVAVIFAVAMVLGSLRPLPFVVRTKLTLDTSVLVAAVVFLDPAVALVVVGSGKLLAQVWRRQSRGETLFNVAQTVLLAAAGGWVLTVGGWHAGHFDLLRPESLFLVVVLGVTLWLLNALAVAIMVALQTGKTWARIWYGMVAQGRLADGLAHLVQVGLGVVAAGVVSGESRLMALVFVPAGAAYPALAHHLRERRRAEAALVHQASHDFLTNLPNRKLLLDRLAISLTPTQRSDTLVGVLFVDLDRFKFVNDSLGHETGDELLVAVAQRLRGCCRPGDTVARLGGDEFVVLLAGLSDRSMAEGVARRIAVALAKPIVLGAHAVTVSTSIGVATALAGQATPTDMLQNADAALGRAKWGGKDRYVVYEPWMGDGLRDRVALEAELRSAVTMGELRLAYQPIVDVATGRIEGVEALVRWQHPERGLLLPGDFIVLAEETGLIDPIGEWVLAAACRQGREWQDRFPAPPIVSVNLSARQFQKPDLVKVVERTIREAGLHPALLRLELTESAVMAEPADGAATMRRLKGLGVQLALDDFGTGYSSLGSLRRFPFDVMKIDRGFVAGLERDGADEAIVRAVVAMAPALGLRVVAEGVETLGQLGRLQELRCELAQGYHFARPLAAEDIVTLLDGAEMSTQRRPPTQMFTSAAWLRGQAGLTGVGEAGAVPPVGPATGVGT